MSFLRAAITKARKEGRGLLIVSNHVSQLDFAYLQCALMHTIWFLKVIHFVTDTPKNFSDKSFGWKRHLFSNPLIMNSIGAWSISRGHKDYTISLKAHIEMLQKKKIVGIFPQGGIRTQHEMHGGAGFLAYSYNPSCIGMRITLRDKGVIVESLDTANNANATLGTNVETYKDFGRAILNLQ